MNQILYTLLIDVAKAKKVITYGEIAPLVGLSMCHVADRTVMSHLLREVSEYEHQAGRPMLSAVVVHAENGVPGVGFFSLAEELGKYNSATDDTDEFFVRELKAVHAAYAKK